MKQILWFACCGVGLVAAEPPAAMRLARQAYEDARAGRVEEAAAGLREATRLAPGNALYRSALGGLLEKRGRLEEAVAEFGEAARLDSKFRTRFESVSLDFGAQLAHAGRFRSGLPFAKATAQRFPESARAAIMLGLFLTRNQQNLAAVEAYRRAVTLAPELPEANVGLGIAQSNAGLTAEAAATFEDGLRRFPRDAMHRQAFGVLLVKLAETGQAGAAAQAARMLESALALDATLAEAHYQLGALSLANGDASAAQARFSRAAALGLDDARLHYAWARALRRLNRGSEADEHLAIFQAQKAASEAAR